MRGMRSLPKVHGVDEGLGAVRGPVVLVGEVGDVPHQLVHDLRKLFVNQSPVLGRPAAQADSAVAYVDQETGFTFSEYLVPFSLSQNLVFRVATPASAQQGSPFDIVLQIVAPSNTGWAAVAWGGSMVKNPITVGWPNGQSVTISSRWAT
jgi:hypothetical protein